MAEAEKPKAPSVADLNKKAGLPGAPKQKAKEPVALDHRGQPKTPKQK